MKKLLLGVTLLTFFALPATSMASVITGGDAANQAAADDILDIIFLIDVSGSMFDDINAIGAVAQTAVQNLECPDCDVFVRATFAGINGSYGSTFNEAFTGPNTNHVEDNGTAAADAANSASGSWWTDDSTAAQDYFRAVVTIGDEGTDNGQPVNQADWDAAYLANQAAINAGVSLFSWVTNDPYSGVVNLFEVMAMGGTGGGHTFGYANGGFVNDQSGTGNVEETLENIICSAIIIKPPVIPEPGTMLLFGTGLVGVYARFRKSKKA